LNRSTPDCYNPATMPDPLIEAQDLTKDFDDFRAVEAVDLRVHAGEVLALLGPNGAGKTTTIRMLASLLTPSRGRARIAGFDIVADSDRVRLHVGLLTEHHGLYTRMRAMEYLEFFGGAYGIAGRDVQRRAEELLEQFGLAEDRGRRLGEYSKGMRQKLALVRTLLHDPPVLLLDEPTSAMDPSSAHQVRESIQALRRASRAIVVCTHNLKEAEVLADRIAIIRAGRIAAEGSVEHLKNEFLGGSRMEVRLATPVNGAASLLPTEVRLEAAGENWLRYTTPDPVAVNPRVLEALRGAGLRVVTLSEVENGLEDVYLQVVRQGAKRG
jgi:ABC-2 type transport system ATP-binding protein